MKQVFLNHLANIDKVIKACSKSKNPAQDLYTAGCRTHFFYLQALGRIFKNLHNKKRFTKIQAQAKAIEDGLGQIDYYFAALKTFGKKNAGVKEYLTQNLEAAQQNLNGILTNNGWLDNSRIEKIKLKLEDCKWNTLEFYAVNIREFYLDEIEGIEDFTIEIKNTFTEFELQVHEMRRKLRWLSIYPTALQGFMQLKNAEQSIANSVYQTKEILNSPFTKMAKPWCKEKICLNKPNFMALSWIILCLGNIKDLGLDIHLAKEIEKNTGIKLDFDNGFTEKDLLEEATKEWHNFIEATSLHLV